VINSKGIKKNSAIKNGQVRLSQFHLATDVGVTSIPSKQPDLQFVNNSLASFVSNLADVFLVYLLNNRSAKGKC